MYNLLGTSLTFSALTVFASWAFSGRPSGDPSLAWNSHAMGGAFSQLGGDLADSPRAFALKLPPSPYRAPKSQGPQTLSLVLRMPRPSLCSLLASGLKWNLDPLMVGLHLSSRASGGTSEGFSHHSCTWSKTERAETSALCTSQDLELRSWNSIVFATELSVSQLFPPEGLVWRRRALNLSSSSVPGREDCPRLPPGLLCQTFFFFLTCPFFIGCGGSGIDGNASEHDHWGLKLRCPLAAYIRGVGV